MENSPFSEFIEYFKFRPSFSEKHVHFLSPVKYFARSIECENAKTIFRGILFLRVPRTKNGLLQQNKLKIPKLN